MSAVLMVMEFPEEGLETYERLNEIMGIRGDADAPEGLIEHVACEDDSGMVIADVWESEQALGRFFETRLQPALEEASVSPGEPPQIMPVHNRLRGRSDEANVLVLVDVEDLGVDTYDQMTSQMDAHIRNEHPSVAHTAAVRPDGSIFVADIWESPDAFGRFAEDQIGPAAEEAGLGQFQARMVPVKNRIRGKAGQPAG
jgi:hypothetical protein